MSVINNLQVLDGLDDATAVEVIQITIEDLEQILANEPSPTDTSTENHSKARRGFERQRDELQRRLRLLWSKLKSNNGAKKDNEVKVEPVRKDKPISKEKNAKQQPGEPSSSPEVAKQDAKQDTEVVTRAEDSSAVEDKQEEQQAGELSSSPETPGGKTGGLLSNILPFFQRIVGVQPSELTQETPQAEDGDNSATSSQTQPTPPISEATPSGVRKETCNVCLDEYFWYLVLTLACGHHFCGECITELFKGATKDESRYPPRCCEPIPLEQGQTIVHWEAMDEYMEKKVEWDTLAKNRTYCSNTECGAFIRPQQVNVRGRTATCHKCGRKTCTKCKAEQHPPYQKCHDPDLQGALNVIEENRWQRCSTCGTGVERELGCNHMR